MGPAKKFIDLLEEQGLLDEDIIVELRRQVAESRTRMTPEIIAKLLVDNEQLTKFQATKLIGKLKESSSASNSPASKDVGERNKQADDELDLAPTTEESISEPQDTSNANAAIIYDDEEDGEVAEVEVVDVEPVEVQAVEVEAVEIEEVQRPSRSKKSRKSVEASPKAKVAAGAATGPQKNPWDSFRVWGMLIVLCLLMIPFVALGLWLWKGNADDLLVKAKDAYEGQDYDASIEKYTQFVKNFGADERASMAKIRVALSRIRKDTKTSSDPTRALATVKEVLPTIASEKSLSSERNDLAGAMLSLAEKFNKKADEEASTEGKKSLIASLDEHLELCKNPVYIGSAERTQYDDRIKRIEEDRARVLRDILRADDLSTTLVGMRQAIDQKDVTKAYNLRRDVVRKHVQLETEAELLKLLKEATTLQQSLVLGGKNAPQKLESSGENPGKKAVLVNRREGKAAKPGDGVVIIRAKKSVYGLNAIDGAVRWRSYLGPDLNMDPKRLSVDPMSDALVAIPQTGMIQRVQAETGQVLWSLSFGRPINEPTIDREEIFVTSREGGIYCLDAATGQTKWGKQIPQPIETGAGIGAGKTVLYVVGNHSNLYALNRKDGACSEVFYLGHQVGTIRVAPIVVLGHVLLFENVSSNASAIRIQKIGDNGLGIQSSQPSIPLKGHVVVSPEVEGRRVAIATDLGEIAILDIEPSKATGQVSRMTGRIQNELQPKVVWPLLDKNDLWVAGSNLTRFQVLVTKQTLESAWVKEDQDAFIGRPKRLGTHIVHSRVLRGTMGVRVSAVDGTTGEPAWEVDLGVPVSMIQSTDGQLPMQAVTSQAALYSVDANHLSGKSVSEIQENAGRNERATLFRHPFGLADGRVVMVNQEQRNQWAVWQGNAPAGNRLRKIVLDLGASGAIESDPIAVGNFVLTPANNGQLHVLDPATGQRKASPFIPTLQANQKLSWIGPALASDKRTAVIADSSKRIYRVGLGTQLRVLTEKDFDKTLQGRLLATGQSIVGVAKDTTDSLEFLSELDLSPIASLALQGHVVWGPFALQDNVIAFTDSEGWIVADSNGTKLRTIARSDADKQQATPIGQPVMLENDIVVATASGQLVRIDVAAGKIVSSIKLAENASGTPLVIGNGIFVPGDDGVVLETSSKDNVAEVTP